MASVAAAPISVVTDAQASPVIPDDIRARLGEEQIRWLERRLIAQPYRHAIDYRVSTSIFGSRFYVALMAGRETRSAKRLQREGLSRRFVHVAFEVGVFCLAATFMLALVAGVGFGLFWLLDSSLGITNLPEYLDKLFH